MAYILTAQTRYSDLGNTAQTQSGEYRTSLGPGSLHPPTSPAPRGSPGGGGGEVFDELTELTDETNWRMEKKGMERGRTERETGREGSD